MEKENGKNNKCNCSMCCHHGHGDLTSSHGRHFILRWVLGLVALFMAFSIGVKIGEFKEEVKSGFFGNPRMMNWERYGDYNGNRYYGMPMMNWYGYPQNSQTAPKNTTTPPPAKN